MAPVMAPEGASSTAASASASAGAESPLLEQQSLDANLQARKLALSINLIRALGGGFSDAATSVASTH